MLQKLLKTDKRFDLTLLRLALGGVLFAHGAQKMLGWFGGGGFSATINSFNIYMHIATPITVLVIFIEFFGSLMLITGTFTRVAALGVFGLFVGILLKIHLPGGFFFMNWGGEARMEGIEYHLLIFGMTLALMIGGAGRFSVDKKLSEANINNQNK